MHRISLLFIAGLFTPTLIFADEQADRCAAMIARVDELIAQRWQEEGVEPAVASSDAEFMRRVYLDLTGVIPRASDVWEFEADKNPDKRSRLIDQLLTSPAHFTHMANSWRQIMLPGNVDPTQINNVAGVQNWLRESFRKEMRYDRMVAEFLVATGGGDSGPALFYTALELQPEKLAASTSRIFLGLQIECAQCHDHPFDHWTQQDFWGFAAFFARLRQPGEMRPGVAVNISDTDSGEVTLPETDTVVAPKYPTSESSADIPDAGTRRDQLAVWMSSRDNPFLPRAAVNRTWTHLFGRGLVDPVDDLGKHNPPSHPELYDELATYFVKSGFDLRELLRTLTNTKAYQLSSRVTADEPPRPEWFASMSIKPMTAEQLYDSLNRSLMRPSQQAFGRGGTSSRLFDPRRQAFIAKMQSQTRDATEYDAGVLQALTLMNGAEIVEATDLNRSGILVSLEAPFFDDQERLNILFKATLSRSPTDNEKAIFGDHIKSAKNQKQWQSDVLWALLNSAEFALNH